MAYFRTGGGTDTSDANATASDILISKTAYVNDEKITGTMANLGDISHTIGAGEVYTVNAGYTSGGTITAIAAGATITVTYNSQFYNKTMTCTKGQTTYTQTTTSSGSTTFSVAEGGTWTITCNGVSRTVDVVLEYSTQMAITQTVTVYGAASDTISFTDMTGSKTVTTNSSGQGSVSITFLPPSQTITFTSSVAKNPSNLSQNYSKNVSITQSTTSVKVMPDGAIYWFGYGYNDTDAKAAGWGNTASYTYCVENTRSIEMKFSSVQCFIGTKNAGKASNGTFKAIAYGTGTPYAGWYGTLFLTNAKIVQDSSVWDPEGDNYMRITGTTRALYSKTYKGGSGYRYISGYTDTTTESAVIEALWIE